MEPGHEPGHEPGILFEGRGGKEKRRVNRLLGIRKDYRVFFSISRQVQLKKYLKLKINNNLSRIEPTIAFDYWSSVHITEYFVKINYW